MRAILASIIGSWSRKVLILGALVGAPVLATAQAAPVHGLRAEVPAAAQTVQWDRHRHHRHWHRHHPRHWRHHHGRHAWHRGYPPPRHYAYRPYGSYYR